MPAQRVLITEDPFAGLPLPAHDWRWISRGTAKR